ncbi:methyltransferase domain-containing protein [Schizophyllum commune]
MDCVDTRRLSEIQDAVSSKLIDGLLRTHPNDIRSIPESWTSWWAWAASGFVPTSEAEKPELCAPWIRLLRYYCEKLRIAPDADHLASAVGMSPKKSHEVFRMTAYVESVIRDSGIDPSAACIVDVGAGQGYLTRTLQVHLRCRGVLALDADDLQTTGAKKWERKLGIEDSVMHQTIWITPSNLLETVDEWITGMRRSEDDPIPVFLVALHACGSLTPTILRTFVAARRRRYSWEGTIPTWRPAGMVAVGCCYNLLQPEDFPMSAALSNYRRNQAPPAPALPASAYHLATQIPGTWLRTPEALADVTLAVRKIVWRALLSCEYSLGSADARLSEQRSGDQSGAPTADEERLSDLRKSCLGTEGTGMRPEMQRLGKLNKRFYDNWDEFVAAAAAKMGFSPAQDLRPGHDPEQRAALESQLSVLHTLRCMIGPLVESLIVLDRKVWLVEQLNGAGGSADGGDGSAGRSGVELGAGTIEGAHAGHDPMTVTIENLFDQATGSGRNMAITAVCSKQ